MTILPFLCSVVLYFLFDFIPIACARPYLVLADLSTIDKLYHAIVNVKNIAFPSES